MVWSLCFLRPCYCLGLPLNYIAISIALFHNLSSSVQWSNDNLPLLLFNERPGFNPWVRKIFWRRKWQPTPVLLPGKCHGRRSLVGCSPWGCQELDTTERLHFHFHFHALEKEMGTYSSVLIWRIPGMGEPGGLPSVGSLRVGHD